MDHAVNHIDIFSRNFDIEVGVDSVANLLG